MYRYGFQKSDKERLAALIRSHTAQSTVTPEHVFAHWALGRWRFQGRLKSFYSFISFCAIESNDSLRGSGQTSAGQFRTEF